MRRTDVARAGTADAAARMMPVVALLCALACVPIAAEAQYAVAPEPYGSDVVSARPVHVLLGLAPGMLAFQHEGSFSPNCDCRYQDASGVRALGAAMFAVKFPKLGVAVRLLATWQEYGADFSYDESRLTHVIGPNPDTTLLYEKVSHVRISVLHLAPGFSWYVPSTAVFVNGSIDVGIPLHARYDNYERIVTPGYAYPDGSTVAALLGDSRKDIPGGRNVSLGLGASIGVDVALADWLVLTPTAGLTLPLTPVSTADDTWRIMNEHVLLVLSVRL